MKEKSAKQKLREAIDDIRAREIYWGVYYEIRHDRYDESDFCMSKGDILKELENIKIGQMTRFQRVSELEDTLIESFGENILLYVVQESELIKKLKRLKENAI